MTKIVEIDRVTVSYREDVALKDASLSIEEGTFLTVIGPNGAGKTTLLTVINGLGRILSGSVRVFGMPLTSQNMSTIRRDVGYIPQGSNIDPRSPISVRQVVGIGRIGKIGPFRRQTYEDKEIVEEAMRSVGIDCLAERPIGHLSGGEQQKVAIARALAQQPRIMLLDEPTANLDPKSQRNLTELIDKIYKKNRLTMVFVTHILSHIPTSCEEAVFVKEGRIVWTGGIRSALRESVLSELYDFPIDIMDRQLKWR